MLKDLENLKPIYQSFDDDFDGDFMIPCYKESISLERGSGFFSLKSLILSFDGLLKFIKNGGNIHLVCNPKLSVEDISLIDASLSLENALSLKLIQVIENDDVSKDDLDKLDVICNLISLHRLEIKVAYMPGGIYHEKTGIFTDTAGNRIYFCGSNNATVQANLYNYESFHVTLSWYDNLNEISIAKDHFDKLWNNKIPQLKVLDFPDAVKNKLFKDYKRSDSLEEAIRKYISSHSDKSNNKKKLYDFQERAINQFMDRNGCSFYEMATGTGKTYTAIKTIRKLEESLKGKLYTIILVPQIDLQAQWLESLNEEGYNNVYLMGGTSGNTEMAISDSIISYYNGDENVVCIAIFDTFFDKVYKRCQNIRELFVIVDEAHNLNSQQVQKLPSNSKYRLGLSATIERHSQIETQLILDYFLKDGLHPFYYGIEEAIKNKFLSHYEYHPIYVNLTQDEFSLYKSKTKAIALEMSKKEKDRDLENLNKLRRDRSLIVKKANNKLLKLQEMMAQDYDFVNSVVYCGQGKIEEESIIEKVTKVLDDSGLDVSTFTSKTENRPGVLYAFETGYYDTLVAIKCFDEGVDVPKLDKIYIMASDTSKRQTVQRRGRVLRKCAETNKTIAYIYDMIALPPSFIPATEIGTHSLIINEFRRVLEYNRLANNKKENENNFHLIFDDYNITTEDLDNYGEEELD